MNFVRQKVYDALESMAIAFEVAEHPAAHTIEEMEQLHLPFMTKVVKNLFVRDQKKKRYYIIVLPKDKSVDLKALGMQLGCGRLSFASEEALMSILGLTKGAVTPFGVLNDPACMVNVVVDKDILTYDRVGVHPNENTATVLLSPTDLAAVIQNHGNGLSYIEISSRTSGE